jgi:hypothetical protein
MLLHCPWGHEPKERAYFAAGDSNPTKDRAESHDALARIFVPVFHTGRDRKDARRAGRDNGSADKAQPSSCDRPPTKSTAFFSLAEASCAAGRRGTTDLN